MSEEVSKIISEIEKDIQYFNKIEFENLANKFERDLKLIKVLLRDNS